PHAAGRRVAAAYEAALAERPWLRTFDREAVYDGEPLTIEQALSGLCDVGDWRGCDEPPADRAAVRRWLARHRELLRRYRDLRGYPHFTETLTPGLAAPFAAWSGKAQRLWLASLARGRRDAPRAVVERLLRDIGFWRTVMAESRWLIDKMTARAFVQRDLAVLASAVAEAELGDAALESIGRELVPLSARERALSATVWTEFRMTAQTMRHLERGSEETCGIFSAPVPPAECSIIDRAKLSLVHLFYQPRASINLAHRRWGRIAAAVDAPPAQALERLAALVDVSVPRVERYYYNPVGRLFNDVAWLGMDRYVARMANADGLIRLVALQAELARRAPDREDVPAVLAGSGARYRDSYTGAPMGWDADAACLVFSARPGPGEKERSAHRACLPERAS
ncbi:MAG: hypothetical protein GWO02_21565, partial [Gammaproteobacteria bacterium]|nr:hypothetical protein [Gammaproteobacteria bacterium]